MKNLKKILLIFFIFSIYNNNLRAELPFYLDFKFILNESIAGKKAQKDLKNKLENGLSNLNKSEKNIQSEEKKIIGQKKLISEEEYKKKSKSIETKSCRFTKE